VAPRPAEDEGVHGHPFSPLIVGAAGAVALGAGIAGVSLELYAASLRDRFTAEQAQSSNHSIAAGDRQSFETTRTWAYAAVGAAAGFAVATAGLGAWYLLGAPRRVPAVVAGAAPAHGGARLVIEARF
jgi:hypothetical protein